MSEMQAVTRGAVYGFAASLIFNLAVWLIWLCVGGTQPYPEWLFAIILWGNFPGSAVPAFLCIAPAGMGSAGDPKPEVVSESFLWLFMACAGMAWWALIGAVVAGMRHAGAPTRVD